MAGSAQVCRKRVCGAAATISGSDASGAAGSREGWSQAKARNIVGPSHRVGQGVGVGQECTSQQLARAVGGGWAAQHGTGWCALRQRCACCAQQPPSFRRLTARPTAAAPAAAARPLASLWAAPDPGTPALAAPWPCSDWAHLGAEQLYKQRQCLHTTNTPCPCNSCSGLGSPKQGATPPRAAIRLHAPAALRSLPIAPVHLGLQVEGAVLLVGLHQVLVLLHRRKHRGRQVLRHS